MIGANRYPPDIKATIYQNITLAWLGTKFILITWVAVEIISPVADPTRTCWIWSSLGMFYVAALVVHLHDQDLPAG